MDENLGIGNEQKKKGSKIPGFRSGKTWKKIIASIFYLFFALIIIGTLTSNDSDTNTAKNNEAKEKTYDLKFEPKVTTTCGDGIITVNADINCPDGAVMQVSLMSADLKEIYNDKPTVKDKKISSTFKLTNKDTKNYAGMVTFQFNADTIAQPENVKTVYGSRGEKLEGDNTKEANFKDGGTGKNASLIFNVSYPSTEAVKQKMDALFKEFTDTIIKSSKGLIVSIEHPSPAIIHMQVSNAWYLSSTNEKQYFAEEMLKNFTQVLKNMDGQDAIVFSIYDESMNKVAESKFLGGMEIIK